MRAVAVMVAMLAFPAVEAILQEGSDQWLGRVLMILLVVVVAVSMPFLDRLPRISGMTVAWVAMTSLAVIGLVLPTWAYLAIRPAVVQLLDRGVGIGPGVWLNGVGHLLIGVTAVLLLVEQRRSRPKVTD